VDKPDTRFVVHYNFPDSLESYYQEAGRAGRDAKNARAVLLYRLEDRRIQGYFLGGKYPRREHSRKVFDTLAAFGQNESFANGVSTADLVTATGLPERKVKVIAAQLEGAGIARRKNRKLLKVRDFASAEEFDTFLSEYEKRGLSDRERLDTMMRYAQTADCRMQFMRDYFGEERGERCGHCDNCAAASQGDSPAATVRAVVVPNDEPEKPAFLQEIGTQPELFSIGDKVKHKKFGVGEVVEMNGTNVTAKFAEVGQKRVKAEFLKAA
jgi:ATP-dependent DNA helicase RecQ